MRRAGYRRAGEWLQLTRVRTLLKFQNELGLWFTIDRALHRIIRLASAATPRKPKACCKDKPDAPSSPTAYERQIVAMGAKTMIPLERDPQGFHSSQAVLDRHRNWIERVSFASKTSDATLLAKIDKPATSAASPSSWIWISMNVDPSLGAFRTNWFLMLI
jgi:hypothetical protein